jgi:hypothetical protein
MKIKLLFTVALVSLVFLLFLLTVENNKIEKDNILLPQNYTLDNYTVSEVSDISCKKSKECITPDKYLIRSNCPYTSLCINNKCNVVCPEYKASNIVGGDRDIHGCIGSAGYSWCEIKNKCLRVWEEKCEVPTNNTNPSTINSSSCAQKGGVWYSAESICEVNQLSESQCTAAGGIFNGCASACRHDPKAQVCNMMCVLTCTFK